MNKEQRKQAYGRYLSSPEWMESREIVRKRAEGKCECCGKNMDSVHHVRYPKRFDGIDHPDNLLAVCNGCHNKLHGVQKVTSIKLVKHEMTNPSGMVQTVGLDDLNRIWAPIESWLQALSVPLHRHGWFESRVTEHSILRQTAEDYEIYEADYKGKKVYRWHPIKDAMGRFFNDKRRDFLCKKPADFIGKENQEFRFWQNYYKLEKWGTDLEEKALSKSLMRKSDSSGYNSSALEQGFALLADIQNRHDIKIQDHQRIIEEHILKDPDEGISAVDGLIELGKDPSTVIAGRQNYEQWVGNWLKQNNYQSVGRSTKRLSGCSIITGVNLWRRCDIREAVKNAPQNTHG